MTRLVSDEEQRALDAAQQGYAQSERERLAELERHRRLSASLEVAIWCMAATLAITAAVLVGWYLGGRP